MHLGGGSWDQFVIFPSGVFYSRDLQDSAGWKWGLDVGAQGAVLMAPCRHSSDLGVYVEPLNDSFSEGQSRGYRCGAMRDPAQKVTPKGVLPTLSVSAVSLFRANLTPFDAPGFPVLLSVMCIQGEGRAGGCHVQDP